MTSLSLFLLLVCLGRTASAASYQMYNYTWVIMNGAGDIVNSSSSITHQTPWPTLEVDLCMLALGASEAWGTPSYYMPQDKPLDLRPEGVQAGCDGQVPRYFLGEIPIYVCPGGHRDRSLGHKCGFSSDFYCAAWGCETTGDTYWKPSSSWDYITVKRKDLPETVDPSGTRDCSNWCNPLVITFTDKGKKATWENRGLEWGLRLYTVGYDPGLTFKIKLLKTIPNSKPVAIGPNQVLQNLRSDPRHPTATGTPHTTLFQPTVPPGPSPSVNIILTMVNESWSALHAVRPNLADDCWLCYHASPPFYEGVAILNNLTATNDSSLVRWNPEAREGMTLAQVSGLGLCIRGPRMRLPSVISPLCNQTLEVSGGSTYLVAPNDTYLACSTGLTPFIVVQPFLQQYDYCVLVQLLPRLTVYSTDEFLNFWTPPGTPSRVKREPITAATIAVLLGLGAVGAGTGISSLVISNQNYHQLSAAIDKDIAEIQVAMAALKDSLSSLTEVVLQNRRGLDLLFLQQGELCAALKEECCFYTDKTGIVEDSMRKVRESLENRKRERDRAESWYKNWFSASPLLTTLLPSLLGPLIGFLLLISFGPWAFRKITDFVKRQIDSAIQGPTHMEVHYHRLEPPDPEAEDCAVLDNAAKSGLDFNKLKPKGLSRLFA